MSNKRNSRGEGIWGIVQLLALPLALVFIVLLIVDIMVPTYGFFAKVDSGYVGIVTHFGEIKDDVLPAGFHFTSYFDKVHPINVRTQIKSGEVVAFSSDIQQVTLTVSINYNVTPPRRRTPCTEQSAAITFPH